jgi:hypothetical protein
MLHRLTAADDWQRVTEVCNPTPPPPPASLLLCVKLKRPTQFRSNKTTPAPKKASKHKVAVSYSFKGPERNVMMVLQAVRAQYLRLNGVLPQRPTKWRGVPLKTVEGKAFGTHLPLKATRRGESQVIQDRVLEFQKSQVQHPA